MQINGHEYRCRRITAGDLAVIAKLAPRVGRHLRPEGADLGALLELWPEIIDAAEQLLQPVVKPIPPADQPVLEQVGGPPDLRSLPLDEAVEALRELLVEWLTVNGSYVSGQVAPAVTELARTITAVTERINLPASPA